MRVKGEKSDSRNKENMVTYGFGISGTKGHKMMPITENKNAEKRRGWAEETFCH